MSEPGLIADDAEPVEPSRIGFGLALTSLVFGVIGPFSLGVLSLLGILFAGLSFWRGGFSRLAVLGLVLSLAGAAIFIPLVSGPFLLVQLSPTYAANQQLIEVGHEKLPPSASDVQHFKEHGFLLGGDTLWVVATCPPSEAKAYMDAAPSNGGRKPIGPGFDPEVYTHPAWYTPDQATSGSHINSTSTMQKWVWYQMTYDDAKQRIYIMVYSN